MMNRVQASLVLPLGLLVGCASAVQSSYVKAGYDAKADVAIKRIAVVAWAPAEHPQLAELLASVAEDRIKLRMNYLVYRAGAMARGWSDFCAQTPCPAAVASSEAAPTVEAEVDTGIADETAAAPGAEPPAETGAGTGNGTEAEERPVPTSATAAESGGDASGDSAMVPATEGAKPAAATPPAGPALGGVLSIRAYDVRLGEEIKLHLVAELHACKSGALLWRADGSEGNPAKDEDLTALTKSYIANLGDAVKPYAAPAFLVLRDILETLPDVVLTDDEVMEKIELE